MTETPKYSQPGRTIGTALTGTEYQIPVNTLFTQVFGLAGQFIRRYQIPENEQGQNLPQYELGESEEEVTEDTITSSLGTPVHFWMAFGEGEYFKRVKGDLEKVQRERLILPYSSIATFTRAKRKTVTYMSGCEGPIVEEYGFEAWNIRIQGFVLNKEGDKTIEQQVKAMQLFENLSDSVKVEGKLYEWLGITNIAFDQISWLPKRESNNLSAMPFEINAMSLQAIELIESGFFENK
ncbi:MAG: hypothetical protein JNK73_13215 [Bacteroidia bacterium]|nr:hypothetical protein [Bacteroidia bacterium]